MSLSAVRSVLGSALDCMGHDTPRFVPEYSGREASRCEQLLDGGEDADIGLAVTLVFGPCAVAAEEGFERQTRKFFETMLADCRERL
jgi:hypothetical protein